MRLTGACIVTRSKFDMDAEPLIKKVRVENCQGIGTGMTQP